MKTFWTKHSERKLRFYNLSKSKIIRIIKKPFRIEEGIAPKTIALMQPAKIIKKGPRPTWKQEIWTMVQKSEAGLKIISAWRYPGKSPALNPIPQEIIEELKKEGII